MAEADFPSNSMAGKSTRPSQPEKDDKKIEQVVHGEVVRRKKPIGKRIKETFVGRDARSVWRIVATDVMLPAAKDMFVDGGREMLERMVYGESRGARRYSRGPNSYTPYHRQAPAQTRPVNGAWSSANTDRRDISQRGRATFDFGEILLDSRAEAEQTLDQLVDVLAQYEAVSVADLYAMLNIRSAYTDRNWGWVDLRGSNVKHVRGGRYLLDLPAPAPLD